MIKIKTQQKFLVLFLFLWLSGCAYNEYAGTFKNAVKSGTYVTITKEENYQEFDQRVIGYFKSRGYTKIAFEDQKNDLIVLSKKGDFGITYQVILKFTKEAGMDKVRVDIINGSEDDLIAGSEVSEDIQEVTHQIQ